MRIELTFLLYESNVLPLNYFGASELGYNLAILVRIFYTNINVMKILTGVDLVYLPRFKKAAKVGGENFLKRVFIETELVKTNPEHLAGIFAAKEAVIKALSLPPDSWHDIQISYQKNGSPQVQLPTSHLPVLSEIEGSLLTSSLSISHDGNYVMAQFTAILKE